MNPSLPIRYVIHYSLRIRMRQEINLEFWRFMADDSFHIFSRQLVPISRFDTSYKRVMSKRATSLTQMNTSVRNGRSDACFFMQLRATFFPRFNNWLFPDLLLNSPKNCIGVQSLMVMPNKLWRFEWSERGIWSWVI